MRKSVYIVSPVYDWAFFLAPPLAALGVGFAASSSDAANTIFETTGGETTGASFAIGVLIHAHLVAVFARSHGHPGIRRRHPIRFWVVPVALFVAIAASSWVAIAATVVATFWDVWHSGAQTFGFGRIYDRNAGTQVSATGRRLDFLVNQVLYMGPILAGATLMDHLWVLEEFETEDDALSHALAVVPVDVLDERAWIAWVVMAVGVIFLAGYVLAQWRQAWRGHPPSWPKVWLLTTTGLVSILAWGLDSFGEAFLIMNLFHAVQYLALVWASEHRRWTASTRLPAWAALAVYLGSVAAYGAAVELLDPDLELLWAATVVVSLMHFWYDGFIWSVREKQV